MKVTLSTTGPFHIYDVARQLERIGHLNALYTAYPWWKVTNLPRHKVHALPWFKGLDFMRKRAFGHRFDRPMNQVIIHTFDRWVSQHMQPCDVFDCLSSFGLASHQVAREKYQALSVCSRGSAHIRYQDRLLAEEYAHWGLPYHRISPYIMARELEEYGYSDMITIPSSFVYRSFIEEGVAAEKLQLLPYGVDLSEFKPIPKEDNIFRVMYVGALTIQKGIPYLLEALAAINLPDAELWLIGGMTDEIRPFLETYQGRLRWLGQVPRQELYRYYSQGSVFVMPSIQDGFGVVITQAMACGLPVIATTHTGGPDVITDGLEGFIVPIRSPEAIREKVLYLYEYPNVQREMSTAARARVQGMGGWQTYSEQLLQIYQQGLARRGRLQASTLSVKQQLQ
jgi:glycosyltransferase involved in cell wall biosynthesis